MTYALEAALGYERRGFSVVPIREHGKAPLLSTWKEWQTRRANPSQIRMWWKSNPDAGVGILTGDISNLLVIDIDPQNGGTDPGLPNTDMMVTTGSGGTHLYYRMPEKGFASYKVKGIDIQAKGKLVVAPPTRHATTGEPYIWDPDDGESGTITVEQLHELIPPGGDDGPLANGLAVGDHGLAEGIEQGFEQGGRNDGIAQLAGSCAGQGMPIAKALSKCLETARKSNPPLSDKETHETVVSIYKIEAVKQAALAAQAAVAETVEVKKSDAPPELVTSRFSTYARKWGGKSERWLIKNFAHDNTIGFIVGAPQSYKTWIEFDMAVAIAGGYKFLGLEKPTRKGTVIILQQEDAHETIAERIATIWFGREGIAMPRLEDGKLWWGMPKGDLPIEMYEDRSFKFTNPKAMESLDALLTKHKPIAVFLDPFYALAPIEDNMERAVEYMWGLKSLRDKHSCSFFIVHHTNKSSLGSGHMSSAWGSQFIGAFMETRMYTHSISGSPKACALQRKSKDFGPKQPMRIDWDIFDGSADEPGEWRYETAISEVGEGKFRGLINPDREVSDEDDDQKYPPAVVTKEGRAFEIIGDGMAQKDIPDELRSAMHKLIQNKKVRFNDIDKRVYRVLTL